jgi:hypothetical protein
MKRSILVLAVVLVSSLATAAITPALAHRPYFEEQDIVAGAPWEIDDPTISTALYATLESASDVDYFAFEAQQGDSILLALTIPQIEGQEEFAPALVLLGPGLPEVDLPAGISVPAGAGALVIEPPPGPAPTFYEPFSRTSYWERQEQRVTMPVSGQFAVAVWHPDGKVGRYTFVIGDKERLGGDLAFPIKMREYWTPVEAPLTEPTAQPDRHGCGP